ncbi:MAG: hypothetical protein KAG97_02060 [Victivallales bacterium]|nr:hypothetical protein [Victivallales bacterium]
MSGASSTRMSLLALAALLCGGCGLFSGSKVDPAKQAKLNRINATLPFSVTVDGAEAAKATPICAKLARPVPNNAELVLGASTKGIIVISFFPCDKDGIVLSGGKPALIILRGSLKTSLSNTLDKKSLKPGFQLMRITAGDQAASVLLDIVGSNAPKKKSSDSK